MTVISIVGCKKESRLKEEDKANNTQLTTGTQSSNTSSRFSDNISVSRYGFLVFPTLEDFEEYRQFLISSTHAEVQEYLNSISFSSLGKTMYEEDYLDKIVTEDEAVNYMFNPDQVFQLKNVVMKPIDGTNDEVKWQFLLTVTTENLSSDSYEKLAAGSFDANTMNKFATNPAEETLDIFAIIELTPSGYEDKEANSVQARRPMFGTVSSSETICEAQPHYEGNGNCVRYCKKVQHTTTYVFWIGFPHEDQILSSWSTAATGC